MVIISWGGECQGNCLVYIMIVLGKNKSVSYIAKKLILFNIVKNEVIYGKKIFIFNNFFNI